MRNIVESRDYYVDLFGYHIISKLFLDSIQKVKVQFLKSADGRVTIELIEPVSTDSPVSNQLSKGGGVSHLCYEVNDIENAINHLREKGARLVSGPDPAVAFNNEKVAFLYTKQRELIEIVEIKD